MSCRRFYVGPAWPPPLSAYDYALTVDKPSAPHEVLLTGLVEAVQPLPLDDDRWRGHGTRDGASWPGGVTADGWRYHHLSGAGACGFGTITVREEAVVPDAMEALWQHVDKEAADELGRGQCHRLPARKPNPIEAATNSPGKHPSRRLSGIPPLRPSRCQRPHRAATWLLSGC